MNGWDQIMAGWDWAWYHVGQFLAQAPPEVIGVLIILLVLIILGGIFGWGRR